MDGDGYSEAPGGSSSKRKRSPSSVEPPAPVAPLLKTAKTTSSSHLQINYLARRYSETLPLVSSEDSLPVILQLLSDYAGVLERHESLASNLGAKPLGPILIQRFERIFDGQPRVQKVQGKDAGTVTWLDVVEFARLKPEQFNLEKSRDGTRVCQFYTKQCRVEISEEDFTLIASGIPQKLIPPQPISEDEEKELGTLEIMEKRITSIIQLADQVSARARQTKHRITGRRSAIASRREGEQLADKVKTSGSSEADSADAGSGSFRAVNSHRPEKLHNVYAGAQNGRAYVGSSASPTTHAELLNCFSSFNSMHQRSGDGDFASPTSGRPSISSAKSKAKPLSESIDYAGILLSSASPVPIPNTPSALANQRPAQPERYDDSGPFKAEMLSRMESMARGERVVPPCDRCRRLNIECLKNLTACLGCTRKHAKCSWKEVSDQEMAESAFPPPRPEGGEVANRDNGDGLAGPGAADDPSQPVRDEELLGEDDSDDDLPTAAPPATGGDGAHSPRVSSPPNGAQSPVASERSGDPPPKLAAATGSPVPLPAPEKVEEAAIQILEKRMEERGTDLGGAMNGFRSVNRPADAGANGTNGAEGAEVANGVARTEPISTQ